MTQLTEEERRQRRKEYLKNYNRKPADVKQRQKPEYRQREILRLRTRYQNVKEYETFKRAIPAFLTL